MAKLVTFIILVWYYFYFGDCGTLPVGQQAEQTLINSLLSGYNKNIRPEDQVSVDITASIRQIIAIDEKQQVMTSSSFISQTWLDDRLEWNSSISTIEVVMIPVKSIWIPDTMILNSADSSGYFTVSDYSLVSVYYTGQVYMILPILSAKTKCAFGVRKFPFDRQICSINLTSWAQGANRILYTTNASLVIDTSGYIEHALWKLNGTDMDVIQATDRAPYEDTYNTIISIQLFLERKPLFFMVNGIFACLVLNCVTLLAYSLPFGTQIGLCMTCFMTYSVYSLNFSGLFPQQSEYLMLITLYFLLSILWTLISMAWFVLCNHYISKGEMPKLLLLFCGCLQKMFCCCFPRPKDDKKTDANKEILLENGQFKKPENQFSNEVPNDRAVEYIRAHQLPPLYPSMADQTSGIDKQEGVISEQTESVKGNPTDNKPIETAACACPHEADTKGKSKCDFCDRCGKCQTDFDKDKAKSKNKKDIESKCSALNYFVLLLIVLFMLISNLVLWLVMAA